MQRYFITNGAHKMGNLLAKTTDWRAYLAADKRAVEIERVGARTRIVIGVDDLPEYERLIAKVRGIMKLRDDIPLPEELEPEG